MRRGLRLHPRLAGWRHLPRGRDHLHDVRARLHDVSHRGHDVRGLERLAIELADVAVRRDPRLGTQVARELAALIVLNDDDP